MRIDECYLIKVQPSWVVLFRWPVSWGLLRVETWFRVRFLPRFFWGQCCRWIRLWSSSPIGRIQPSLLSWCRSGRQRPKSFSEPTYPVFLCLKNITKCFRRESKIEGLRLLLTKQKGTSCFLQSWGSQSTNSMGSTSNAITTNLASLFSIKVVTWFRPNFKTLGFWESLVFWLSTFCWAVAKSLAFFSFLVSGEYFFKSLKSPLAKKV